MGKTQLLKKLNKSEPIQQLAEIITTRASSSDIGNAGARLFGILYGGDAKETLTELRQRKFKTMISSCKKLEPHRVPPTARAAHFHALRVHLQTQQWLSLDEKVLDPLEFGWKTSKPGTLSPVGTDLPPAPDEILNYVRCKCKSEPRCGGGQCSCRKNGLRCVDVCGGCHGRGCLNEKPVVLGNGASDNDSENDEGRD